MLKPSRRDWPLLIALLAVVLALLANFAAFSSAERSHQPQSQQTQTTTDSIAPPQHLKRDPWIIRAVDDPINLFTGVLALLTLFLVGFGGWQAWLTRKSIDLGRAEFLATHRPKVIMQRIDIFHRSQGVALVFTNAGETPALVTAWNAFIYYRWNDSAFWPQNISPLDKSEAGFWLVPGQSVAVTFRPDPDEVGHDQFRVGEAEMFVVGTINYSGTDQIARSTGFCRKWFRGDGSWRIQRHSEYEYCY